MSTTLDVLWSLHGPNGSGGVAETVEFVARRGSRRSHFFFFGRGFGSAFFVVPVVLVAAVGGYLMRNPDKARGLKERLKGAWKAGGSTLDSYRYPTPPYSGPHQGPGPDPNVHPGIRPENPWPANPPGFQTGSAGTDSMRFNPRRDGRLRRRTGHRRRIGNRIRPGRLRRPDGISGYRNNNRQRNGPSGDASQRVIADRYPSYRRLA